MQTVRGPAFNLASVNKLCLRSVSINSVITAENESTHLKSYKEIPGPSSLPIVGQLRHFLPGGFLYNKPEPMMKLLYENYGPIVRLDSVFGSDAFIFLFDAQAAAFILRNENWMPIRPGFGSLDYYRKKNQKTEDSPLGLLTDQNEAWKKFRSTVNPIMMEPKTVQLYSGILEKVAEDMVTRIRNKRNEKLMIEENFDIDVNLWALESISVVALGVRLNCLTQELPDDSPEKELIQIVHDIIKVFEELDFNPSLWRYIPTPTFQKAMKCYEKQLQLSKYFIREAVQHMNKKNNDDEKSILQKLLEINEDVAVIMATEMLIAGVDTVSNHVTGTLYLLAKNQDKQDKLREEIMSNRDTRPYLKACLKEALRIMPIISFNSRKTTKEYSIMGYKIPKNMRVSFGHHCLSLLEEQYPRPEEYIPERWIVDKTDPLYHGNAEPLAYSPFGFGARSCIGRRLAILEIETFLTKVIENFKIEWIGSSMKVRPGIVNYTMPPFNFVFKDIK